jgi:hypothetical protein
VARVSESAIEGWGLLSLVALPVVGSIFVTYGMGMAMGAGSSVGATDKVIRVLTFVPAILACFALGRARSKLTVLCALPTLASISFLASIKISVFKEEQNRAPDRTLTIRPFAHMTTADTLR